MVQIIDFMEYPTLLFSSIFGYSSWLKLMHLLIASIHLLDISSSKTWQTFGEFLLIVRLSIAIPIGQGALPMERSIYLSLAWMYYRTRQQFIMWYTDRIISFFPPLFLSTWLKLLISPRVSSKRFQLSVYF